MHRSIQILAATLLAIVCIVASPKAARANTGVIHTVNDTRYDVWITIYDLGRTRQIDYGRVAAGDSRTWGRCCYAAGSYYYVRAEVMLGHKVIFDTSIQVVPTLARQLYASSCSVYGYARVVLVGNGAHFHWERRDDAPAQCM
jgi:hypothetical protein